MFNGEKASRKNEVNVQYFFKHLNKYYSVVAVGDI